MPSLRLALRTLLRSRGFTAVVVLSLGLGVGACTVVFSLIRSVYGSEPPYPDPDRIVEIASTQTSASWQRVDAVPLERVRTWMDFDFRALESFAARATTALVLGGDEPERVEGEIVSGSYFEILRVPVLMGRWLSPPDDEPLAEPTAVISEALWKEKLSGESSVLGSVIEVSGDAYTVVGVMPKDFAPAPRIWLPAAKFLERGFVASWYPVGRLRAGVTLLHASTEVHELAAAEIAADSTLYGGYGAVAVPFVETRGFINRTTLWILVTSALGILLLAVTNLATLFLVRGVQRGRSAGIRLTLGASAWQLGRGMLIESLLVAIAGALLAVTLSVWWGGLVGVWAGVRPGIDRGLIDPLAVAFAALLSLGVAVLVGSEPLRHVLRLDLRGLMQGTTSAALGPRERITRDVMVGTQVGLAMTFASVGVVLSVAYTRFEGFDLGYDAEGLAIAVPDYQLARIEIETQPSLMAELVARVAASPSVQSAAMWRHGVQRFPPKPEVAAVVDGNPTAMNGRTGLYRFYEVGPSFFETVGIPIVAGRDFGPVDGAGSPAVGIVSQAGAKAWWPGQDPIGRQLKLGEKGEWITVVGVAGDAAAPMQMGRQFASGTLRGQQDPAPLLYRPLAQAHVPPDGWIIEGNMVGLDGVIIGARARDDLLPVLSTLGAELSRELPQLPLRYLGSLHDWQVDAYTGRLLKLYRALLATLAAAAFFLSLLGVTGIVADGVVRRTREIGIRKALGARSGDVTVVLAREGLVTTLIGLFAGLAIVFVLGELVSRVTSMNALLLGRGLLDWPVLSVVGVTMVAAAVTAACFCTLRASRLEPSVALRSE